MTESFIIPEIEYGRKKDLVKVSRRIQVVTREIIGFCVKVIRDPSALVIEDQTNSVGMKLAHRSQKDIYLSAVFANDNPDNNHAPVYFGTEPSELETKDYTYYQIGVTSPEGLMMIGIKKEDLLSVDLSNDPFADHVVSYFRSHFNEGQDLII